MYAHMYAHVCACNLNKVLYTCQYLPKVSPVQYGVGIVCTVCDYMYMYVSLLSLLPRLFSSNGTLGRSIDLGTRL